MSAILPCSKVSDKVTSRLGHFRHQMDVKSLSSVGYWLDVKLGLFPGLHKHVTNNIFMQAIYNNDIYMRYTDN